MVVDHREANKSKKSTEVRSRLPQTWQIKRTDRTLKRYRLGLHTTLSTTGWADKWKYSDIKTKDIKHKKVKNFIPN